MEQITYEYNKYITTIDNLQNTLNTYGVAIIPGVLNQVECNNMKEGIWNYLEYITTNMPKPINRNDTSSWKTLKQLYPKHSMLLQLWSVGLSEPHKNFCLQKIL